MNPAKDQFGNESYLLDALEERNLQIRLEQRPRAESDMAVAAASILARAEFVRKMVQLSRQVGKRLPKGAFDPSIITVGQEIVAHRGEAALAEVAKVHFNKPALSSRLHLWDGMRAPFL